MKFRIRNYVLKYMRAFTPAIFFLAGLLWLSSCKKEGNIGLDVQPVNDLFGSQASDTLTLITQAYKQDTIRTDESTLAVSGVYSQMIGSYYDPVFGKTSASVYAQLSLPGNVTNVNLGLPAELALDSVVLTLPYAGKGYGTPEPQTFKVYQLDETIYRDSAYYSSSKKKYTTPLGSKTFIPNTDSSVTIGSTKLKAHLRVKLDSTFGAYLLNESGGTNLSSNANFQAFFKGMYIMPDNPTQPQGQGSILYYLMNDPLSALTLYYKNTGATKDTAEFSFLINTTSAYFNHFEHDYTTSVQDIQDQVNSASLKQNNTVYIQPMQGLKTKITFPHLKNLVISGQKSINRAELILMADPATTATYGPPARLFVAAIDSAGKTIPIADTYEGDGYYGGIYNSTTKEFRFNVTRHIQSLLTGGVSDYGLYLLSKVSDNYSANALFLPVATGSTNAERVVLGGGGNSAGIKMKLKLTFTKFN